MNVRNDSGKRGLRVAVSGSNGCIGSRLVSSLRESGCDVIELPSPFEACVSEKMKADVFVNLAWRGSRGIQRADYALQLESVKMSLDYYMLALRMGCRKYLCPGTIGELMVDLPECSRIRAQSFMYVNAKSTLRRMLAAMERPDDCKAIWMRLGNIYGTGDSGNVVGWTLSKILLGEKASFGPAIQPYEFVAIDDCTEAIVALVFADTLSCDCYYVGCGAPRELREWLIEIGRVAGREDLIAIGERPDDGARYRAEWFDISALVADTWYRPKVQFTTGVSRLVTEFSRRGTQC